MDSLEQLWQTGQGIIEKAEGQPGFTEWKGKFLFPAGRTKEAVFAAAELAARIGYEISGLKLPLTKDARKGGGKNDISVSEKSGERVCRIFLEESSHGIGLEGNCLHEAAVFLAGTFPAVSGCASEEQKKGDLCELKKRTADCLKEKMEAVILSEVIYDPEEKGIRKAVFQTEKEQSKTLQEEVLTQMKKLLPWGTVSELLLLFPNGSCRVTGRDIIGPEEDSAKETPACSVKEALACSVKETPLCSAKEAPTCSVKEASACSVKETPLCSAKEAPTCSAKETPAGSAKEVPAGSAKEAPTCSAKETPAYPESAADQPYRIEIREEDAVCFADAILLAAAGIGLHSDTCVLPVILEEKEREGEIPLVFGRKRGESENRSEEKSARLLPDGKGFFMEGDSETCEKLTEELFRYRQGIRDLKRYFEEMLSGKNFDGQVSGALAVSDAERDGIHKDLNAADQGTLAASDAGRGEPEGLLQACGKSSQNAEKTEEYILAHDICFEDFSEFQESGQMEKLKYFLKEQPVPIRMVSRLESTEGWSERSSAEWEGEEFLSCLRGVLETSQKGDRLEAEAILGEEPSVREKLVRQAEAMAEEKGVFLQKCEIFCAYKQGLCRIMEKAVPALKRSGLTPDRITIRYPRRVIRDRQSAWENLKKGPDGASAGYFLKEYEEAPALEPPERYLHELYPVDDLLSKELSLPRDRICFEVLPQERTEEGEVYEVTAADREGKEIFRDVFPVYYTEQPYLKRFPKAGVIYPSTGHVKISRNGKKVLEKRIRTDSERFWEWYQDSVLEKEAERIFSRRQKEEECPEEPFFQELRVEAWLSEPDLELPCRNDRISVLEGLHEDIYYVTRDFFLLLGNRFGRRFTQVGLVLPILHRAEGTASKMTVTETQEYAPKAALFAGTENKKDLLSLLRRCLPEDAVKTAAVSEEGGLSMELIFSDRRSDAVIRKWLQLAQRKLICGFRTDVPWKQAILRFSDGSRARVPRSLLTGEEWRKEARKKTGEAPLNKEGQVIDYSEYERRMEELEKQGVRREFIASSYFGRRIEAAVFQKRPDFDLTAEERIVRQRPSVMMLNRHHANEVSSTTSAFRLIRKLQEGKEEWKEKLNLVILPMENPDGTEVHHFLAKEHPKWKLHAAYTNGMGAETAGGYWKESRYPECSVMEKVWKRWEPKVIADNHGITSHEADQPFGGYINPVMKGFWLPKGFIYGIFYRTKDEKNRFQKELADYFQEGVAGKWESDPETVRLQREWRDRYRVYAAEARPDLFEASYDGEFGFVTFLAPEHPAMPIASLRFPEKTPVFFVTEAADETAQGEYLDRCAAAHELSDEALLERASRLEVYREEEVTAGEFITVRKQKFCCRCPKAAET